MCRIIEFPTKKARASAPTHDAGKFRNTICREDMADRSLWPEGPKLLGDVTAEIVDRLKPLAL